MTIDEQWLPLREFPDDYEVSSIGRIRRVSAKRGATPGRIRSLTRAKNGYLTAIFYSSRKPVLRLVHRLVADAFLGPIPDGMQVNHKNGDKADNRLENLEIVTNGENRAHSYRVLGVAPNRPGFGPKNHRSKLTWEQIDQIRADRANGASLGKLGKKFGMSKQGISSIVKGKVWREETRPPHPH